MTELLHLENYSFTYPQQLPPGAVPCHPHRAGGGVHGTLRPLWLRKVHAAAAAENGAGAPWPAGGGDHLLRHAAVPDPRPPSGGGDRLCAAVTGESGGDGQGLARVGLRAESSGLDTPTIRGRVGEDGLLLRIQDWFYKNVTELSGGQKQLLSLASVMVMQPRVLILDEPTSQLDPIAASDFLQTLGRINRELGTTVLLTEHRLEEALPLATHAAVMDGGRLLCTGAPAEVGGLLRQEGHRKFLAMPSAMRIWASVQSDASCPVTVREGRAFLTEWLTDHPARPLRRRRSLPAARWCWRRRTCGSNTRKKARISSGASI